VTQDLQIWVVCDNYGSSVSLEMVPFDSLYTTFYYHFIAICPYHVPFLGYSEVPDENVIFPTTCILRPC